MRRGLAFIFAFSLAASLFAAEEVIAKEQIEELEFSPVKEEPKVIYAAWPVPFAFCQIPSALDVVGLRLTIPFSSVQENVTGLDLGFWGSCRNFEGFQFNVLRNRAIDSMGGWQCGIYNTVNRGEFLGLQIGLWNEAGSCKGVQLGIVNLVGDGEGFQFGLINRAEDMHGYQIGLINVIRSAELSVLPIINIGF